MENAKIASLREIAKETRKLILDTAHTAGAGHTGGSLSETEILVSLYFEIMRIDPKKPLWEDRDRFILSKGHASVGLYSVLAQRGYFDKVVLKTFDQTDSILQAHPDMHKCPGIDYSTGSLGQGLSIGIGIAQGAAKRGKDFRTFVLLGDGESQEGQVWEALMYAGFNKVKNLIAIFDYNKVQLSGKVPESLSLEPLNDKIKAFNWQVLETDGHDIESLIQTLERAVQECKCGPVAIIAHTVKGKGISFMENRWEWHGKAPDDSQYQQCLAEMEGGDTI